MRVGLFITCLGDTLFPETGRATVRIMERLGHTVVFPEGQTCCGQMHANSGYADEAAPLLGRFVDRFGSADVEAIVAPSGSCVAMVRHHYPRLAAELGDPALEQEVAALAPRVFELTELLVDELGIEDVGASYPHRVAYHPSCHGLRLLRLGAAPARLLRNVRGIELLELGEAEACCGFGGTFAVKNADVSAAMLTDKVGAVLSSGAEVCTATDSSCLMHIGGALRRRRSGVRAVHIAEILAAEESG
ncbi:MAG: (Fe-S)-binding protein [Solirubrobacterales bacterium]